MGGNIQMDILNRLNIETIQYELDVALYAWYGIYSGFVL